VCCDLLIICLYFVSETTVAGILLNCEKFKMLYENHIFIVLPNRLVVSPR